MPFSQPATTDTTTPQTLPPDAPINMGAASTWRPKAGGMNGIGTGTVRECRHLRAPHQRPQQECRLVSVTCLGCLIEAACLLGTSFIIPSAARATQQVSQWRREAERVRRRKVAVTIHTRSPRIADPRHKHWNRISISCSRVRCLFRRTPTLSMSALDA